MPEAPLISEVLSVSKRGSVVGVVGCLLIASFAVPCVAVQDRFPLELTWDAPPSCPQLDDVEEQIRTLISGVADAQWQSSLRARGSIVPSAQRFELTLVIQQGLTSGKRVIASDDCQSLGKAAAVVLGLLMRKEQRLGRELSEQEISGDAEQATQPATSSSALPSPLPSTGPAPLQSASNNPIPMSAPATARHESWSLVVLGPNVVLDIGTLPHPNYGLGLGVGVISSRWRAIATGNFWLPQSTHPFQEQVFQASFHRQSAEVTGCHAWSLREGLGVGPCVQLAFDHVSAEASGGRLTSRSESSLLFAGGAGLGALWRFGSDTALAATAMGRATTHRPRFVLETPFGSDGVHTVPALTAAMSLGFVWIF